MGRDEWGLGGYDKRCQGMIRGCFGRVSGLCEWSGGMAYSTC